ncbi:hypothetical protein BDN72DRAFT_861087 [Pluteus cervinus]|uniref:Uncharacterized protein n=1 Tax=Pluteus cervinus TaxID=181527 RepID=A0ACD3AGQ7_9AGAR|nr:hypothetical protein BDN72DRAFT_861087 [Pluteus cervinus]
MECASNMHHVIRVMGFQRPIFDRIGTISSVNQGDCIFERDLSGVNGRPMSSADDTRRNQWKSIGLLIKDSITTQKGWPCDLFSIVFWCLGGDCAPGNKTTVCWAFEDVLYERLTILERKDQGLEQQGKFEVGKKQIAYTRGIELIMMVARLLIPKATQRIPECDWRSFGETEERKHITRASYSPGRVNQRTTDPVAAQFARLGVAQSSETSSQSQKAAQGATMSAYLRLDFPARPARGMVIYIPYHCWGRQKRSPGHYHFRPSFPYPVGMLRAAERVFWISLLQWFAAAVSPIPDSLKISFRARRLAYTKKRQDRKFSSP